MEAVDPGIELIVCMTESIPVLDMVGVTGVPGFAVAACHPNCFSVISRSGTLTYDVVK